MNLIRFPYIRERCARYLMVVTGSKQLFEAIMATTSADELRSCKWGFCSSHDQAITTIIDGELALLHDITELLGED